MDGVAFLERLMLTVLILAAATGIGEIFFRLGFTDANIITVYLFGVHADIYSDQRLYL